MQTATTVEMNGRDKNAETATTVEMNGRDKNAAPHLQNANGNSHTSHNDDVVSKEAHKSCLASLQQSQSRVHKTFQSKINTLLTHYQDLLLSKFKTKFDILSDFLGLIQSM